MSSPYESNNPYTPSTQYPPSGYPADQPSQYPPSGYPANQPPQYGYVPMSQQVYIAAPQYVAVPVVAVNEPGSTPALVGMILGIISIFFWILAIPGLIVSIFGLKSITRKGMAIAGMVTSSIALLFMLAYIAFFVAVLSSTPRY